MLESRIIEGRWWLTLDRIGEAHYGVLKHEPETGLELSIKIPRSRSNFDVLQFGAAFPDSFPETIRGNDVNDKPVALFGCVVAGTTNSCGMISYRIIGSSCLIGAKHETLKIANFATSEVHYTLLHRWVNRSLVTQETLSDGWTAVSVRLPEELIFTLNDGVCIRIDGETLLNNSREEYRIGQNHRIYFHFPKTANLETIQTEYARPLRHLLSFLTGEPVYIEKIEGFEYDPFSPKENRFSPPVELLVWNRGVTSAKTDVHSLFMIASFSEVRSEFQEILRKWFSLYTMLQPVLDLHFIILFGEGLYMENRFLFWRKRWRCFMGGSHALILINSTRPNSMYDATL